MATRPDRRAGLPQQWRCSPPPRQRRPAFGTASRTTRGSQDGPGTLDAPARLREGARRHDGSLRHPLGRVAPTRPARALASSDPAYRWASTDAILEGLRARGIAPLVTLYGTAPWANGGRKPNVAPTSPTTFADFAYAAAKRYPFVRKWTVWNEPNQRLSLAQDVPAPLREAAAQSGLRGDPSREPARARRRRRHGAAREHRRLRPACLGARHGGGAREARRLRAQPVPDAPARVALPRGVPVLRRRSRWRTWTGSSKEVRRDFGSKQIWLTEYGYQTNPPDRVRRQPERAGAVRRRGGAARVPAAGRDDADPVPRPRRAAPRALPERALHVHGVAKPAYSRVSLPARAGHAARLARDALGTDAAGQGRAARTGCRSSRRTARGAGSARRGGRTARASSRRPSTVPRGALIRSGRRSSTPTAGRCLCVSYDRAL